MAEFEWTERLLNIPYAVATQFAAPGTNAFDEAVSAANLAVVKAAACYDPGAGSELQHWLFRCARWAARRAVRPQRLSADHRWAYTLARLDAPVAAGSTRTLGELLAAPQPPPEAALTDSDLLARALSKLSPLPRAVYTLYCGQGYTQDAIAETLGVTRYAVASHLNQARKKLARYAATVRSGSVTRRAKNNLRAVPPPRSAAQRAAAARFCRERAGAARLLGVLPRRTSVWWYAADDDARTLHGPGSLKGLLAHFGIAAPGSRAHLKVYDGHEALEGRRLLRGPQAQALADAGYRLIDITQTEAP